jgi:hypothetical protein
VTGRRTTAITPRAAGQPTRRKTGRDWLPELALELDRPRSELTDLFRTLTERVAFLAAGGTAPSAPAGSPPADNGIVGPEIQPDGLTATVSVGASLFDGRYRLASLKPVQLVSGAAGHYRQRDWCSSSRYPISVSGRTTFSPSRVTNRAGSGIAGATSTKSIPSLAYSSISVRKPLTSPLGSTRPMIVFSMAS